MMNQNKAENISTFSIAPEDITWRMRYNWLENIDAGSSAMLDTVIPYFESEAINRLESELRNLKHEPPKRRDGFDSWRSWWLNEAMQNCDSHSPIGRAGGHLSRIAQAAVNVLMVASELRDAIHYKRAEKSSALGMLLVCEALEGGFSIELSSLQNSKKKSYEKGIGGQAKDFTNLRKASVDLAKRLWKENPDLRIGDVANEILARIKNNASKFPTLEAFPKVETIKTWLKEASAAGKLAMPDGAQRRGRSPKTTP